MGERIGGSRLLDVTTGEGVSTYRSCGLAIRSDRTLPGLAAIDPTTAAPDLTLLTGPSAHVPPRIPTGQIIVDAMGLRRPLYCAVRDEEGYLFRVPELCDVRLTSDLQHGIVSYDPSADPELVRVLLSGTLLALVLSLRGRCVLHASAVDVDGRGLAFVGHSGMGKSTLTVTTCVAGAELITEDVLVTADDDPTYCLAGNTDVRLRKAALTLLDRTGSWPQTTTGDGRRAVRPPRTGRESVQLDTIVIPRPDRHAEQLTVRTMPAAKALVRLVAFPRVIGLIDPEVARRQFEIVGRIVRSVPVLVVTVPWGPPFATDLGEQLIHLMRPASPPRRR